VDVEEDFTLVMDAIRKKKEKRQSGMENSLQLALEEVAKEKDTQERELSELREQLRVMQEETGRKNTNLQPFNSGEFESLASENRDLRSRIEDLRERLSSDPEEVTKLEEMSTSFSIIPDQLQDVRDQRSSLAEKCETMEKAATENQFLLDKMREELDFVKSENQKEIDEIRKEMEDKQRVIELKDEAIRDLQSTKTNAHDGLIAQLQKAKQVIRELDGERKLANQEADDILDKYARAEEIIRALEVALNRSNKKFGVHRKIIHKLAKQNEKLKKQLGMESQFKVEDDLFLQEMTPHVAGESRTPGRLSTVQEQHYCSRFEAETQTTTTTSNHVDYLDDVPMHKNDRVFPNGIIVTNLDPNQIRILDSSEQPSSIRPSRESNQETQTQTQSPVEILEPVKE